MKPGSKVQTYMINSNPSTKTITLAAKDMSQPSMPSAGLHEHLAHTHRGVQIKVKTKLKDIFKLCTKKM